MREDSPQEIALCLSCTKPENSCNFCHGPSLRMPHSRVPLQEIMRAFDMLDAGAKQSDVARQLGVSPSTVYHWIGQRKEWEEKNEHEQKKEA